MEAIVLKFVNEVTENLDSVPQETKDAVKSFVTETPEEELKLLLQEELIQFTREIKNVETRSKNIKTKHFDFFNDLVLFGGLLEFKLFINENKNTKLCINTYLLEMLGNLNVSQASRVAPFRNSLPQMDGEFGGLLSELAQDLQRSNVDPMKMLNSLLSGNGNGKGSGTKESQVLKNLISKIETKVKNGEIDINKLGI